MLAAAGLAVAAKPRMKLADAGPKIDLETLVPQSFGEWRLDRRVVPVLPSPEAAALLSKIYSQTLSRTYVNSAGDRVMLSIAYGGDQSDAMQVHRPEICYPAQGFAVLKNLKSFLTTRFGQVPVTRLIAVQGPRVEPITYWITVGDQLARSGWEQKLAQLKYGMTGKVPDGLLFRVSSIDRDEVRAYDIQSGFVHDLLDELGEQGRRRMIGRLGT
jgi:EpsI family protein